MGWNQDVFSGVRKDEMNLLGRVLVAAAVFAGIVALGTLVTKRGADVRARVNATMDRVVTPADTAEGSALYGRYRAQRDAAFAMRVDLLKLVALDSALAMNSTYNRSIDQMTALFRLSPGNMGPYVHVTPRGWWATIQSMYSTITCAVAVGADTIIRDAPPGTPVCYGQEWN